MMDSLPSCWVSFALGGGAVFILGLLFQRRRRRACKFILPRGERERGVVYLYQFSRCVLGPNASPFCMKLEVFLRMNQIPHKVIATRRMGPKNKMPYIIYNDQVVSDSDFIVEFLMKELKLSMDDHLDATQRAIGHATEQMLEECTYWTVVHRRWVQTPERVPYLFFAKPSLMLRLVLRWVARSVTKDCYSQGMGRHSVADIARIAQNDLRSVAGILADKPYLLGGDSPSSYDVTVFSSLAVQLWQLPGSAQESFIRTEAPNLLRYCERMREKCYPDWDELCAKA